MSRARILAILPRAIRGTHVGRRGIETYRGANITVSAAQPFPVHIDGEYIGRVSQPLELKALGRSLPVLSRRDGNARRAGALVQVLGEKKG